MNLARFIKKDFDECAKSGRIVVFDCFCVSECFEDGVGVKDFLFEAAFFFVHVGFLAEKAV